MCLKRKAIAQHQERLPRGNAELVFHIVHFVKGSEIWIQFSFSNTAWAKQNIYRPDLETASGLKLQLPVCISLPVHSQK